MAMVSVLVVNHLLGFRPIFNAFYLPILLAHYFLHLRSARFLIQAESIGINAYSVILPVTILATAMTALDQAVVMAVLISFHTIFSDVYFTEAISEPNGDRRVAETLRIASRVFFGIFAYLACIDVEPLSGPLMRTMQTPNFVLPATVLYLAVSGYLGGRRRLDTLLFDALWLLLLVFTAKNKIPYQYLVLYHLLFWLYQPIVFRVSRWRRHIVEQAVVIGVFGWANYSVLSLDFLNSVGGYFHLTLTLFISRWNPVWLLRLRRLNFGATSAA